MKHWIVTHHFGLLLLEFMAEVLNFSLEEFGPRALQAEKFLTVNAMCTVFAESEVTSLVSRVG